MLRKNRTWFDDPPPVPPTVPPVPPPPPAPRVFTQAEVDKMMQEHRTGLQQQNAAQAAELQKLRESSNLTLAEKDALDARINALQQQHLTDAQKKEQEVNNLKKKYETDTTTLTGEVKKWQGDFQRMVAVNALKDASATHGAANPKQIEMMLLNQVKVVEGTDAEGKPTGQYVAKITTTVVDPKTKQPTQVDLPVAEAVEIMKKDTEYANLFVGNGKGGFGGSNGTPPVNAQGQPDFKTMTPLQYREWRAKQAGKK